jgi:hypothetical protein
MHGYILACITTRTTITTGATISGGLPGAATYPYLYNTHHLTQIQYCGRCRTALRTITTIGTVRA